MVLRCVIEFYRGAGTREEDSVLREDFELYREGKLFTARGLNPYREGKTLPRERTRTAEKIYRARNIPREGKLSAGKDVHREGKTCVRAETCTVWDS